MNKFNPSKHMIDAATEVFAYMALCQTIKEKDTNIRTQCLEAADYKVEPETYQKYLDRNLELPVYIKDPKEDYLMAGLKDYQTDTNTDWARYHADWDRRMQNAGFIHGANTLCRADMALLGARHKLFTAVKDLDGMAPVKWEQLTGNPKYYKQFFELTLKLFADLVDKNVDKSSIEKKIYQGYAKV